MAELIDSLPLLKALWDAFGQMADEDRKRARWVMSQETLDGLKAEHDAAPGMYTGYEPPRPQTRRHGPIPLMLFGRSIRIDGSVQGITYEVPK